MIPLDKKNVTGTRYKKSPAVKALEVLADEKAREKHPDMPPQYLAPRHYRDDTANGLTRCIIEWLRLNGHQAERINTTGRYIDRSKVFTDTLGHSRIIGSGRWIRTSGTRGSADISATVNGKAVKVEVKAGRDRQSKFQKEYQRQIEAAGGVYIIARSLEDFEDQIKKYL